MIAALVHGDLISEPVERTTAKGAPFVTATVRVPAGADALLVGIAIRLRAPALSQPAELGSSLAHGGETRAGRLCRLRARLRLKGI